ncbi:hypothetical protein L207DRAFT_508341 [Hyaloscypha variabilis F]|uniref:Uncharacterized protein n=1 Tax=Hyaloscypha variabilis (strain UAMH 11265 / GT02V1 / F) TaxID=1149755 RepID=A0A2J6S3W0_HYAVF|nr:hypothetical protein L207DRAFT_508341 [Hyaloscypha variabilis F]
MMCFGKKSKPQLRDGSDRFGQSRSRSSIFYDQQYPNKPLESIGDFMASTPGSRNGKNMLEVPESKRRSVRSSYSSTSQTGRCPENWLIFSRGM